MILSLKVRREAVSDVGQLHRCRKRSASGQDAVRQRFTGYQKDTETGLDFAEARMYENRFGRFTAVDPLLASGKSANPQTFNRYAYTSNNPITRVDINGKDWIYEITHVKVKETYMTRGGSVKTRERTIEVQKPIWVESDDASGIPRISGVQEQTYGAHGFWALDPKTNRQSQLFATREEAQEQFDEWNSPKIEFVVFNSTLTSPTNAESSPSVSGSFGHFASGIDGRTYSWDDQGYDGESKTIPNFDEYVEQNAKWRSGTVYTLDFGPTGNRKAADAIRSYPLGGITSLNGKYSFIGNNCGESFCRVTNVLNPLLGTARDNSITPAQHGSFIENNLKRFIVNRRTFGPPPGRVKFQNPCSRDRRYC